jgi:hypothetical protein
MTDQACALGTIYSYSYTKTSMQIVQMSYLIIIVVGRILEPVSPHGRPENKQTNLRSCSDKIMSEA